MVSRKIKALVPAQLVPLCEDVYCWYKGLGDRRYLRQTGYPFLPPAPLRYQVGSVEIRDFIEIGSRCAHDLESALEKCGKKFTSFRTVLDFGCGCGRTLVWLRRYSESSRLHGADMNGEAITWCRKTLDFAEFKVNHPSPPLEYPQELFDLVYAISVFTHMDEQYQFAWLSELKRIVKPLGILLISVHGSYCWQQLSPEEISRVNELGIFYKPSRSLARVFPKIYQNTYHTREYIFARWPKYFTILDFIPRGINDYQDLVVLEKKHGA